MNVLRSVLILSLVLLPFTLETGRVIAKPIHHIDNHWPDPTRTSTNMLILVRDIYGMEVVEGSELACFTPDGHIGGRSVLDPDSQNGWGLAGWGDDPYTDEIEGFLEGQEITLLYWDPVHHWELEMSVEFLEPGSMIYHTDAFIIIEVTLGVDESGSPASPIDFQLEEIYPNPFNSHCTVAFSLTRRADVVLSLCDVSGREVKRLFDGTLNVGRHRMVLDGANLVNGLYMVVLTGGRQREVERLVLLK
ncbi:T9SS type A sorting domain-containing protein [bacterium]|nr:T9SS type A sorting domain-containing protein [bacterium]